MPTFTTPGPIAAIVEVAGAQVRVDASDRTDTTVLVEPLDTTSRRDLKVAESTKVTFADGNLSVETKTAGARKGSVAITIELPAGSSLAAYLAYSTVRAGGTFGASEVRMASGQVRLDRVETLRASIASGDVGIGHVAGRADIEGAAFTLRIDQVDGPVGLTNAGGQTWIGHAAADVALTSGSCDFEIERADGSVTAETGGGALRIGRMTNGRARLRNGSGDIEVGITEGSAASIDVESERGGVHNYVTSPGEPGPADAKVSVFARTRHGDITIQRAVA
jgi:Putative adhesin